MKRSRSLPIVAAWLALLTTVAADYRAEFREGVRAFNRGDWTQASRRLRAAIAEQPNDTGERIQISGGDFENYMPHALLGLVLYRSNSGGCSAAMAEWQLSRGGSQDRAWPRLSQGSTIAKLWTDCQVQIRVAQANKTTASNPDDAAAPALTMAIQRAEKAISAAEQSQRHAIDLGKDPKLQAQWSDNKQLGPAQANAERLLQTGRTLLVDGRARSDSKAAAQAEEAATRAKDAFDEVARAANDALAEPPAVAPIPLETKPGLPAGTGHAVAIPATPIDANSRGGPGEGVGKTGAKEGRGTTNMGVSKPPEPGINPSPLSGPPASGTPPVDLRLQKAAGEFFQARYVQAVASLEGVRFDRAQDTLQAELFQAASNYALYVISGATSKERQAKAEQHVRKCRQIRSTFEPDRQFFSPRFIEFYRSVMLR